MFTIIIIIIVLVFIFGGSEDSSKSNQSYTSSNQKNSNLDQFTSSLNQSNAKSVVTKKVDKSFKTCPHCKGKNFAENFTDMSICNECGGFLSKDYLKVRLAGVTYEGRQEIIAKMNINNKIQLKRDKNNKYDKNAIGVYTIQNQNIGWIPKDVASTLTLGMDAGTIYHIKINKILGGNGYNFGIEALITKGDQISKTHQEENSTSGYLKSIDENKYAGSYRSVVAAEDKNDYLYESSSSYIDTYDDYNEYADNNDDDYGDSESDIEEHQWEYNENH